MHCMFTLVFIFLLNIRFVRLEKHPRERKYDSYDYDIISLILDFIQLKAILLQKTKYFFVMLTQDGIFRFITRN